MAKKIDGKSAGPGPGDDGLTEIVNPELKSKFVVNSYLNRGRNIDHLLMITYGLVAQTGEHNSGFSLRINKNSSTLAISPEADQVDRTSPFFLKWPKKEDKEANFNGFKEAILFIFNNIDLRDTEYAKSLDDLCEVLAQSSFFRRLSEKKKSKTSDSSILDHVKKVSSLLKTDKLSYRERFILRVGALFHDIGKFFDFENDTNQDHAFIASLILEELFEELSPLILELVNKLRDDNQEEGVEVRESEFYKTEKFCDDMEINFGEIFLQTVELIRLHHIFEKLEMNDLAPEIVIEIFGESNIDLGLLAIFTIADGGSLAIEEGKGANRHKTFLIKNLAEIKRLLEIYQKEKEKATAGFLKKIAAPLLDFVSKITEDGVFDLLELIRETFAGGPLESLSTQIIEGMAEEDIREE